VSGRDALVAYAVVAALVAVLVRIDVDLPAIGHLGSALVAVVFLYAPVVIAWKRHEDLFDYGFRSDPLAKNLATAGVVMLLILPPFAAAYLGFYSIVCDSAELRRLAPPGTCAGWHGVELEAPKLGLKFLEFCAVQLVVVALPEELFFRGCLHRLLEERFPPARRWFGGGVGLALLLSSLAFALVHLPKNGDPRALATFFPGLLFGWMRSRTGSILPSVLVHASSNIWVRVLDLTFLR
jgi:uncharacterized protein